MGGSVVVQHRDTEIKSKMREGTRERQINMASGLSRATVNLAERSPRHTVSLLILLLISVSRC